MKLYYLGVAVTLVEWVGEPQWVWCEWPDGKRWRHWYPQLTSTPWGKRNVSEPSDTTQSNRPGSV